jgi:hypothetical protein
LYSENENYHLKIQSDGHITVVNTSGHFIWGSISWGAPLDSGINKVAVENGNLVISASEKKVWESKTGGHPNATFIITNTGALQVVDGTTVIFPK